MKMIRYIYFFTQCVIVTSLCLFENHHHKRFPATGSGTDSMLKSLHVRGSGQCKMACKKYDGNCTAVNLRRSELTSDFICELFSKDFQFDAQTLEPDEDCTFMKVQDGDQCLINPCQHGGLCVDRLQAYTCQCPDGYTGVDCETDVDECRNSPCQNDGTCEGGVNGYNCTCPAGIYGANCEVIDAVNECSSNPCMNGGHCVNQLDGYTCECPGGITGNRCQTVNVCSKDLCTNGGTCGVVEPNRDDPYPGLVNLMTGATCEAPTPYTGTIGCDGALNDCYQSTIDGDWVVQVISGTIAYIKITFTSSARVTKAVLWFRCAELWQSSGIEFKYSDNSKHVFSRTCNEPTDSTKPYDCTGQPGEVYDLNSPMTTYVKITLTGNCGGSGFRLQGLREVELWGPE